MLRDTKLTDLPSYDIGMERGIAKTNIENAIIMVKDFNIRPEDVAIKLNISLDELTSKLKIK